MSRPTPAQDFAAAAVAICIGSWIALAYGVVRWWLDATELNDLGVNDEG